MRFSTFFRLLPLLSAGQTGIPATPTALCMTAGQTNWTQNMNKGKNAAKCIRKTNLHTIHYYCKLT